MNAPHQPSYLSATVGIRSWLLTTDHKRIALLYFASITFFFAIGGLAATVILYVLIKRRPTLGCPDC
jgi:cytochrome c oxidase subunit 1